MQTKHISFSTLNQNKYLNSTK